MQRRFLLARIRQAIAPPFLYHCPKTGDTVQAWVNDEPDDDDLTNVQVTCLAWAQAHQVNPKRKVLGDDEAE